MRDLPFRPAQAVHPHAWLWEPFEERMTFSLRSMFGFKAVYLDGKIMFVFCTKQEPWRGVLICTSKDSHASLMADFPALAAHPVLGKWLYLPEANSNFDGLAERIVRRALNHDPRIGVVPPLKKKRASRGKGITRAKKQ